MKVIGIVLVFIVISIVACWLASASINQRNRAAQLTQVGSVISGEVLDVLYSKSARRITYSFICNGHKYVAIGQATKLPNLSTGDSVQVHYLPSDPNISAIDLRGDIENSNQMLKFLILCFSVLGFMFLGVIVAIKKGNL